MWSREHEDPVRSLAAELTDECNALLAGRYADYLHEQGHLAAPWVWMNALAHASQEELTEVAAGPPTRTSDRPGTVEWRRAIAFLAEEVLERARSTGTSLADLQRSALVPLELELMACTGGAVLSPGQLAGLVMAAVHRHPSRRRP
jgi:hypothetical protein